MLHAARKRDELMSTAMPVLRLLPPQRVADSDLVAPLQYTIADTARLLAVSRRTVERLIARGELATVGTGRLKRVPYDSIVAYLNRQRNEAA
jgi:excisionase family DNA binding protein